jgi:hypothetical protein
MIGDKKIVVVTPAGRKRYMEILLKYILRERDIVDEYRIWVNTKSQTDVSYFENLKEEYEGFVTLDERHIEEPECGENTNIHRFFDKCTESNTIYIRLDDDVIWLSENFIKNLVEFRIENPDPLLVYPAIINNAVCDSIFQNLGHYSNFENFNYDCVDSIAYTDSYVCEGKHREMLSHIEKLDPIDFTDSWVLRRYERISINCICWFGESFADFKGVVDKNEEVWLSCVKPKELKRPNVITGRSVCAHFAFGPQREHMDKTNILNMYKNISNYITVDPSKIDLSKIEWNALEDNIKLKIHILLTENNIKY